MSEPAFAAGGCFCGAIRYHLTSAPMFVHCCHCLDCQKQTGGAFAINALIERDRVVVDAGEPVRVTVPTDSGRPHDIYRCPTCQTALWSDYGRRGVQVFVRVSTLDLPHAIAPDVHIFTRSKVPWVGLPADARAFDVYYELRAEWPAASQARRAALGLPLDRTLRTIRGGGRDWPSWPVAGHGLPAPASDGHAAPSSPWHAGCSGSVRVRARSAMTIHIETPVGPDDHIRGNPAAAITLVEYGDFECPYCARAYPIVKTLLARFPDDLRVVFRHAPQTRQHPAAERAAEAAEAAGAQDRFWPFHDRLFERPEPLDWPRLLGEARALELDLDCFTADVELHRFRDVVTRLERSGAHTVRGTPTFFLDGVRYEDTWDVDTLSRAIAARRPT